MKNLVISITAARLAIASVITYQTLLFVLIFLRPDLDPSWNTISEWAIGPYGWVMSIGFLTLALSYGSLFVSIRSQVHGALGKIGLGILLICVVGTVGVGVFTTDPLNTPQDKISITGMIHMISGFSALMLLPFAALLINLSLAFNTNTWNKFKTVLLLTGGLPLLALAGFWIHLSMYVLPLGENAYGPGVPIGWPPRLLFLVYMIWLVTLARQAIEQVKRK